MLRRKEIAAPMGEQGQGRTAGYRLYLVCGHLVEGAHRRQQSPAGLTQNTMCTKRARSQFATARRQY
jgi:hypothetical protein